MPLCDSFLIDSSLELGDVLNAAKEEMPHHRSAHKNIEVIVRGREILEIQLIARTDGGNQRDDPDFVGVRPVAQLLHEVESDGNAQH